MVKFWRVLGDYNGEAVAFEAFAGAGGASPYNPDMDARLIGIRTISFAEAATSLAEAVIIRLTCTTFKPNAIHVASLGNGLKTVPQVPNAIMDYVVDQEVKSGVPITLEGMNLVATAVTQRTLVLGLFEA